MVVKQTLLLLYMGQNCKVAIMLLQHSHPCAELRECLNFGYGSHGDLDYRRTVPDLVRTGGLSASPRDIRAQGAA